MCVYSTMVPKNEMRAKAKPGETLTVQAYRLHAQCLVGDDNKVVCIKAKAVLTLKEIEFNFTDSRLLRGLNQPNGITADFTGWIGKKNVKVTMIRFLSYDAGRYAADGMKLPDGKIIHMGWMKIGSKVEVYKPPVKKRVVKRSTTGKPGMKVIAAAIKEAVATTVRKRVRA